MWTQITAYNYGALREGDIIGRLSKPKAISLNTKGRAVREADFIEMYVITSIDRENDKVVMHERLFRFPIVKKKYLFIDHNYYFGND
ncbi:hypothetical protein BH11BAC6_BH11BAC6_15030 [soil metagenome]